MKAILELKKNHLSRNTCVVFALNFGTALKSLKACFVLRRFIGVFVFPVNNGCITRS